MLIIPFLTDNGSHVLLIGFFFVQFWKGYKMNNHPKFWWHFRWCKIVPDLACLFLWSPYFSPVVYLHFLRECRQYFHNYNFHFSKIDSNGNQTNRMKIKSSHLKGQVLRQGASVTQNAMQLDTVLYILCEWQDLVVDRKNCCSTVIIIIAAHSWNPQLSATR